MLSTFDFGCNGFIRCNGAFERFRQVYFKYFLHHFFFKACAFQFSE